MDGAVEWGFDASEAMAIEYGEWYGRGVSSIALRSDGKILVLGQSTGKTRAPITLINSDGRLDKDFNPEDDTLPSLPTVDCHNDNFCKVMVDQADNAYFFAYDGNSTGFKRLTKQGLFDKIYQPIYQVRVQDAIIDSNNQLVVAGVVRNPSGKLVVRLNRYNAVGQLDPAFKQTLEITDRRLGDDERYVPSVSSLTEIDDGYLISGDIGVIIGNEIKTELIAVDRAGNIDENKMSKDFWPSMKGYNFRALSLNKKEFVFFGTGSYANNGKGLRYHANGQLVDTIDPTVQTYRPTVLKKLSDSSVVSQTYYRSYNKARASLAQYSDLGVFLKPLLSFDYSIEDAPSTRTFSDVAVQQDGTLFVAGEFSLSTDRFISKKKLLRIKSDGSPDLNYDLDLSGGFSSVDAMITLPDDRVIIFGSFTQIGAIKASGIARITRDGQPDVSFNSGQSGFKGRMYYRVVLLSDGNLHVECRRCSYNGVNYNSRFLILDIDGKLIGTSDH